MPTFRWSSLFLLSLTLHLSVSTSHADWLVTPFVGGALASRTTLIDLERAPSATRPLFGVSGGWLSDGILGLEGSLVYSPGFFQRPNTLLVGSHLRMASGAITLAAPLGLTRESLRPYLTVGVGSVHVALEDVLGLFTQSRTMPALVLGGGALGFVSRRTGVRFDIRQVQNLDRVPNPLTAATETSLRFWQASVGIALRY